MSLGQRALALDVDDDELVTPNEAAVTVAFIAGLSGALLLLLYILLKVSVLSSRDETSKWEVAQCLSIFSKWHFTNSRNMCMPLVTL